MLLAVVLAIMVAGIALIAWVSRWASDRRAARRGESPEPGRRALRRGHIALLAYFGGAFGCAALASALGASSERAADVAGVWQLGFLAVLIAYAIQRRRDNN